MTKTVLFVCPHGAAKSVLAAAYFQRLVDERALPFVADCAGTEPDYALSPAVAALLASSGLAFQPARPRPVTNDELRAAYHVVSFGCDLPARTGSIDDWSTVPALSLDFEAARAEIERRVASLVASLAPPG